MLTYFLLHVIETHFLVVVKKQKGKIMYTKNHFFSMTSSLCFYREQKLMQNEKKSYINWGKSWFFYPQSSPPPFSNSFLFRGVFSSASLIIFCDMITPHLILNLCENESSFSRIFAGLAYLGKLCETVTSIFFPPAPQGMLYTRTGFLPVEIAKNRPKNAFQYT